jgi:hypothetical protein
MDAQSQTMLITLNITPALEEPIIDWLLERDAGGGFTGYMAFGHGSHREHLSVAEQVSGRQRRLEFRIELDASNADAFITDLRQAFTGADVYYYVSPVAYSGHL